MRKQQLFEVVKSITVKLSLIQSRHSFKNVSQTKNLYMSIVFIKRVVVI